MEWYSLHIYYYDNQDRLLVECIAPLVSELRASGESDRIFFLRYTEGGPHVRLRVAVRAPDALESVGAKVEARVREFQMRHPSQCPADRVRAFMAVWMGLAGGATTTELAPDNTFVRRAYEPEFGRYGGKVGVEIAEVHFDFCSSFALELLTFEFERAAANGGGSNRGGGRLATAMQIVLVLLSSLGSHGDQLERLLREYVATLDGLYGPNPQAREFNAVFERRGPELRRLARASLAPEAGKEGALVRRWRDHGAWLADRLRTAEQADSRWMGSETSIFRIVTSYVHMLHNRLGLSIRDEQYLCTLAARTIASLQDEAKPAGSSAPNVI